MDDPQLLIYHCSNCQYKYHISQLQTDWFDVNKLLCNDCNKNSFEIKYHFYGHSCNNCNSFNTTIVKLNKN